MKNKIRFGIIGCSSIAERNTIPAIKQAQNSDLRYIGSRYHPKAQKFSKKFSCRYYGSYEDVLETDDVDAVYISLPISLQEEWVLKSAKAGKHILCEKSAATSYKSAKKMVNACKKNNVQILEAFSFVYHPQQKKVLEIIKKRTIGKIFSFSAKFGFVLPYSTNNFRFKKSLGGGVLNDVGCYLIRASRMIFQTNPISVNCDLYIPRKNGVDIKGTLHMKFPNNCNAIGLFSYCDAFQSTYDVWGRKGKISLERAFNIRKNMRTEVHLETENTIKKIPISPHDQFEIMINDFCKKISSHSVNRSNFGQELIHQALVLEKARKSNDRKKTITI